MLAYNCSHRPFKNWARARRTGTIASFPEASLLGELGFLQVPVRHAVGRISTPLTPLTPIDVTSPCAGPDRDEGMNGVLAAQQSELAKAEDDRHTATPPQPVPAESGGPDISK